MKTDEGQFLPDDLGQGDHYIPRNATEAANSFATFRTLAPEMKAEVLCQNVAKTFGASLTLGGKGNMFVELIADTVKVNLRNTWTPTTSFLSRLKSSQLDEIAAYIGGFSSAFLGMKKRDKVARLHAVFNNEIDRNGMSDDAKARIATWVPEGVETITPANQDDNKELAA